MSGNKMSKTVTKFKNEKTFEERVKEKGGYLIFIADEPCLTCGHRKYIAYPERTDGRVDVRTKCLTCSVKVTTSANRNDV